jgi:c-di-GMP-binding flagellar brake protein YcgR
LSDAVKHLQIGDVLQLQFTPSTENPERYSATLVGFLPGQSLVITTPRKNSNPIIIRDGQSFTVRMLQGSNIFGFVARVLHVSSKPYPHIHLAYPEDVESAVVRNAPRVPTELQAVIINPRGATGKDLQRHVTVSDLSSTGARVIDTERLGEIGGIIQLTQTLSVCGGNDVLKVLATIRNIRESPAQDGTMRYLHGLEFRGLNRFQQLLLCSYVLGSIARERG